MQRIHGFPDVSVNADRSTTVPGFVVSSPPPPTVFLLPYLPMWPSPRLPWPPSSSVRGGGGPGSKGIYTGAGRSAGLQMQRRRGTCFDKRHGGNPTDARRLEIVVDGLTLFDGAHVGVSPQAGWNCTEEGDRPQRCCSGRGTKEKGEDLSRACWGQRTRPFGRPCSRSRREMVGRDCQFPALKPRQLRKP